MKFEQLTIDGAFILAVTTLTFFCTLFGCGIGDVASTHTDVTATSATDNSTDNSLNGISRCTEGSTGTCSQNGPGDCTHSVECINANGEPVTLAGPEPIDCSSILEVCPTPTPAPEAPPPATVGTL